MNITISKYEAICCLGSNADEIYQNAINGKSDFFDVDSETIPGYTFRLGKVKENLPEIDKEIYKTRCNSLVLYVLNLLKDDISALIDKYGADNIAVIGATTNSGVDEFEKFGNKIHSELGNPAMFVKDFLHLGNIALSVSTACSSGNKAFKLADSLIVSDIAQAVLVVGVDSVTKLPLYGFSSLEILTPKKTNPFSKNVTGINIGEGCACFIVEKSDCAKGIKVLGVGENSDTFHSTTPDPEAKEAKVAILEALKNAKLSPADIDYINLHGTGTLANDLMESVAINEIFGENTPSGSTKPLTGHCLGAASSIEAMLCCHLMNNFNGKLLPHIYDGEYNPDFKPVKLVKKDDTFPKCRYCLSSSFGFGGTNAIIVLGKDNE